MSTWMSLLARRGVCFVVAMFAWLGVTPAWAQIADPVNVQVTLEGCRNGGTITLPDGTGAFICPDAAYTTGNLGKGWNELDLVPHRLTLQAGGNAPANQTYRLGVAVDNLEGTTLGYDVLSSLTLNTAKSTGTCSISVGVQTPLAPGVGGTDVSLTRLIDVTQTRGSTCVFDFYARLAIGSSDFSGSSLHANALNKSFGTAGVGARDVSIPVKDIIAQSLSKDMTAKQGGRVNWSLTKQPPADIKLGDVCKRDNDLTKRDVEFKVTWTKGAVTATGVHIVSNIYAYNPAARAVEVSVRDVIFKGTDVLYTSMPSPYTSLGAGETKLVMTNDIMLPAAAATIGDVLTDVATGTYRDPVIGDIQSRTTTATASATVVNDTSLEDASVAIADVEHSTGGVLFSVAPPTIGSFRPDGGTPAYVSGYTTGPVIWGVGGQTDSGSITFVKTVTIDGRRVVDGSIVDTARLELTSGGSTSPQSGPFTVRVTSSASVGITVNKSIPPTFTLDGTERLEVSFLITRVNDPTYSNQFKMVFRPGVTSLQAQIAGLVPDEYIVKETGATFFRDDADAGTAVNLNPLDGDTRVLKLYAAANGDKVFQENECAGVADFVNRPTGGFANARVKKTTAPSVGLTSAADTQWEFTLYSPAGLNLGTVTATANDAAVTFSPNLTEEGVYTVVETTKSPAWVLRSVTTDANTDLVCEFKVDFPEDAGKTFDCVFHNEKQGRAQIKKTLSGQALSGASSFTFELRQGASTTAVGTVLQSVSATAANLGMVSFDAWLVPGAAYQLCEVVMPGWNTNLVGDGPRFVPGSMLTPTLPNTDVSNETVCVPFTVTAGQVRSFAVDNTPPPEGLARTIGFWKNWTSCDGRGNQAPVLDQTLAKAEPTGIVVSATDGSYAPFGGTLFLVLHGSVTSPDAAPSCATAISLLDKSTVSTGKKSASDPAFNLAAQLVAAQLNYSAGAAQTVTSTINAAVRLLGAVGFNGDTHGPISKAQAALMNGYARTLDDYNNNR